MNAKLQEMMATQGATQVCALDDILPDTGVCAWVGGRQVAVFRVGETDEVYAIDNYDANSGANVLARGLIGDLRGRLVVASPIYKHHFDLKTGECLENPEASVRAYPARGENGSVYVAVAESAGRVALHKQRLVVVGNDMAGMRTVEELLRIAPELYEITVFGVEPYGNYNRILLSLLLAGAKTADKIMLHTPEWYARQGITLHAGDSVVAIDRRARVVRSQSGREVKYDRLLLATGSKPFVIPVSGKDLPGVITFRDIQDVDAMLTAAKRYRKAVVIGGGLRGLEAANGLMQRGMDVTVVHLMNSLMERQLDKPAATLLQTSLERRGLKFLLNAQTAAILGESRVTGLRFQDETEIAADLVVMAVGIKPNVELAQKSGLHYECGVVVDDTLQTYDPRIYAVGECIQHRNATYGLVAPLWEQARVCATHLAEMGHIYYRGSVPATRLKVPGIELFSAGDFIGGKDTEALVFRDPRRGVYKRLVIQGNRIQGAVLYGDVKDSNWYFDLMNAGKDIGSVRDRLLFGKAFCEGESAQGAGSLWATH
jgi:nitrite reductase (NADH) large subunit